MKSVSRPPHRCSSGAPDCQISRYPLAVAEGLEPRRLLSVTLVGGGIQSFSVPQGTAAQSADLNQFFLDTATFTQDLTFKATSDNPTLVSPSLNGSVLTLSYSSTIAGYAHVQVTATDPSGMVAADTFRVKITASPSRSADVMLGVNGRHSFTFTAPDRTFARITLSGPGVATIHLGGDFTSNSGGVVRGINEDIESIAITGSTGATTLDVRGHLHRHGGIPGVGDITSDGGFGLIRFVRAQLLGDLTANGPVPHINMDYAQGGTISVGMSSRPMHMNLLSFVDENFSSGAPVRIVAGGQWLNSDSVPETFTTPWIHRISFTGSFLPGLQLSGVGAPGRTLGHVGVLGFIGGPWSVHGQSSPLSVGATAADWNASFDQLSALRLRGQFGGSLSTPTIDLVKVGGAFNQARLNLTAPSVVDLKHLQVAGDVVGSFIQTVGSIGSISAEDIQTTGIFAGVGTLPQGQLLPQSASDFASSATIGAVTLRPRRKRIGFIGSAIAATNVGNLFLATTRVANNGTPFGVVAHQVGRIDVRDLTNHQVIHLVNLQDPAGLAAQVAAEHLNLQDFLVRLV